MFGTHAVKAIQMRGFAGLGSLGCVHIFDVLKTLLRLLSPSNLVHRCHICVQPIRCGDYAHVDNGPESITLANGRILPDQPATLSDSQHWTASDPGMLSVLEMFVR
jgi:hypothetical protein